MLPKINKEILIQGEIPRIIHQTWKSKTVPKHWEPSKQGWEDICKKDPRWQYILWTDAENRLLIQKHYSWFLDQYDAYPYNIQRVDCARCFILHHYGGIYCDLDIAPKPKFAQLFDFYKNEDVVIAKTASAHDHPVHPVTNAFMMSKPNQQFWNVVFKEFTSPTLSTWKKIVMAISRHFTIIFSTGPGITNNALKIYTAASKQNNVSMIPMELVQPLQEWETRPGTTYDSTTTLLNGGSWHNFDSKFFAGASKFTHSDGWIMLFGILFIVFFITTIVFTVLYFRLRKSLAKNSAPAVPPTSRY